MVERRIGDRSSRAPRFVPGFVEGFVEGELEAASMGRCMGGRSMGGLLLVCRERWRCDGACVLRIDASAQRNTL